MFVIVLISFIVETFGLLTTVPENAAVIAGIKVVLKCRTNETSKKIFWRAPVSESRPNKIFDGERIAKEWSEICYIDSSSSGQYDLIINSTMSVVTQFVCQEGPFGHVDGSVGSAEIVVLAADPECSINGQIEDEMVTLNETTFSFEMRCTVRYSGNWTPLMEWRQEGCQEPISAGVKTTVENDTVISTLTISANVTYNSTRYICTTRFDKSHKLSSTTADNVPNYSYNWTSPIIVITNDKPVTTSSFPMTKSPSQLTSIISVIAVLQGTLVAILVLLLLRRRIKKKTPSNTLDLHVVREADILQHSHGTSEPVLGTGLYDTMPHAYAAVNHPMATEQNAVATGQHDLYSTVKKAEKAEWDHKRETSQQLTDPVKQHTNIGADGTEYAELPAMKSTSCSQQKKPTKNLFDTSIYAQIDHTGKVPPPPPPQQALKFLR